MGSRQHSTRTGPVRPPSSYKPAGSKTGTATEEHPLTLALDRTDRVVPALWQGCAIKRYHLEARITDMLIRDVPDDVIADVEARAGRLGLSSAADWHRTLPRPALL